METLRDETSGEVIVGGDSINKNPENVKAIIGARFRLQVILKQHLLGAFYLTDLFPKFLRPIVRILSMTFLS